MRCIAQIAEPAETGVHSTVKTEPSRGLVIAAFAAVYVIWGSTYLGIRIAITSIPPFIMAGSRFLLAGIILYAIMRMSGVAKPACKHWRGATVIGVLLLLGGNGAVSWAQQRVPTGITALIVAAVPLWIMLMDWLRPRGNRPTFLVFLGLCIGFAGVLMIVTSRNQLGVRIVDHVGGVVLLLATLSWAFGSVYSRHAEKPDSALLAIAMQMIAGGISQLLAGLALGETRQFHPMAITSASAWSFVYLTLIGSLVGFTAYVWLLQVSTPAKVSTYAYVNPIIAVLLGYLVLSEPFPKSVAMSGALVLAAVVLITHKRPVTSATVPPVLPSK